MKITKEIRWVIAGRFGLYTGQWHTRKEAIRHHVEAYIKPGYINDESRARAWKRCRSNGDRAVKAVISYR